MVLKSFSGSYVSEMVFPKSLMWLSYLGSLLTWTQIILQPYLSRLISPRCSRELNRRLFFHCLALHTPLSAKNHPSSLLTPFYPLALNSVVTSFSCQFSSDLSDTSLDASSLGPFLKNFLPELYYLYIVHLLPTPIPFHHTYILDQTLANLCEVPHGNHLHFTRRMLSVTKPLCPCRSSKMAIDDMNINGCSFALINLYLLKQAD